MSTADEHRQAQVDKQVRLSNMRQRAERIKAASAARDLTRADAGKTLPEWKWAK